MAYTDHLKTAGGALKRWFIATLYDAAAVAAMWLVGLLIIGVPWAPLWALLGGLFQFVPNLGPVLALIGPTLALLFTGKSWESYIYLLICFAVIAVADGLFVGPYFQKRSNRVPVWASIVTPIAFGMIIPFWGVLLAPPFLAIVYAFRGRSTRLEQQIADLRAQQVKPATETPRHGDGEVR